ncbi:PAS domain S-box-containing protein [Methylopila capsulata]|uniref:histidine kinase n=1 Tax=Methylopila capsulata TaxID=61654 RepID=A0A9W6MTZ5_9HYPH|nr:PAS domain-containing protein [Methylopila capsulata]MBM7853040.1 PAS domain S-box-containing protein [Methylopila capsulata]GLK57747.1 hybrid sensor histidine kinase/response regulator [Methylopila capsulata]
MTDGSFASDPLRGFSGEVATLLTGMDLAGTPLGDPQAWPQSLRTTVGLMLAARAQIVLFWGPDHLALYNDAYAPTIGDKHPRALCRPARENWSELWDDLEPLLRGVWETGETCYAKDRPFYIERGERPETVWFDISYQAVRDEAGAVAGILCIVSEQTKRVLTEMRLNFMVELSDRLRAHSDPVSVKRSAAELVGRKLGGGRAGYAEIVDEARAFVIDEDWTDGVMASLAGRHDLSAFGGPLLDRLRSGAVIRIDDVAADTVAQGAQEAFARLGAPGMIAVPLVKDGAPRAVFYLHAAAPRLWTDHEVEIVAGAAERTWAAVEQARAEQLVVASEARFQAIANSIDQMIWSTQADGYHDYFNDRWYEFTGVPYGSTDGAAWNGMFHPEDQERAWSTWRRSLETGAPYHIEYRLRHRSGQYRWVIGRAQCVRDAAGAIVRWYGTCTDIHDLKTAEAALRELNETLEARVASAIAERRTAEDALRQAQKMESLGQLTGGVAHDFNNLLQVVVGNLEILRRNLPEESGRLRRAAENATTGANRAATLTQRLLAFSRRQPLAPQPIDANRLVTGMAELLARTLGETIHLETVQGAGVWRVEADPNQLEAAILNLAVNARDAMPSGGKLTIETSNTHLDKSYAAEHAEVPVGQYVVVSVSDNGSGMTKETLAKAFEPFFTTKEVGKGTGLGLSMVYGFVKQSGGHVKIYSEIDEGTTVKIYLPRLMGETPEETAAAEAIVPEGSRAETVLVVEDDDDVRMYSVEVLRELGYRVLEAYDGASALRLLERPESRVDLLFTDVVLPGGMNGEQIAKRARVLRPDLKVLFTTGYARNAIVHHGRLDVGVELITKPFTYADLAARIRDVLDAPPKPPRG